MPFFRNSYFRVCAAVVAPFLALVMFGPIVIITLFGTNATSTFQVVGPGTKTANSEPTRVQVAPPPRPVEMVEVPVAAKDLPVGTQLRANEQLWVTKAVRTSELPKDAVVTAADLVDTRLIRAVRAGETFAAPDVVRGTICGFPGLDRATITFDLRSAVGQFVAPGSKVDVVGSIRTGDKLKTFTVLVDTLVVSVGVIGPANEANAGLALTDQQTVAFELARVRGYELSLKTRPAKPDDTGYDLGAVLKLLEGHEQPAIAPLPRPVPDKP